MMQSRVGYQKLGSSQTDEPNIQLPEPVIDRIVDRAVRRLEEDYQSTIKAKWSPREDPRIERLLNDFEQRLSRLEEVMMIEDEDANNSTALGKFDDAPVEKLQTKLGVEEIIKQARSIQLNGNHDFEKVSVAELIAQLKWGT